MFVQKFRQHRDIALRLHRSILANFIKILAELQTLKNGEDVGLQTSETQVKMLANLEYFLEVCSDGLSLKSSVSLHNEMRKIKCLPEFRNDDQLRWPHSPCLSLRQRSHHYKPRSTSCLIVFYYSLVGRKYFN